MALRTRLTERLGIRHPILLAPMGFVSGGALAAAVSAAGGLGLIGGGYAEAEWLNREFDAAGNQRIGCGFITWAMARRPAVLDEALQRTPAAVMLSFGDASPFIPRIKRAGALVICQVQSVTQARQVLDGGADIVVAQGSEAGGHGGGLDFSAGASRGRHGRAIGPECPGRCRRRHRRRPRPGRIPDAWRRWRSHRHAISCLYGIAGGSCGKGACRRRER